MEHESAFTVETVVAEASIRSNVTDRRLQQSLKRAMDVCCAAIAILILLPVLAIIGLLVKLDSQGPVIFKQERIGRLGKHFTMWKFRTMCVGADSQPHRQAVELATRSVRSASPDSRHAFKPMRDPRITRIGKFLRTWNLDELPQLINVVRGEMSLVGPRPALDYELPFYKDWQFRRFAARPGLSGLWQVKRSKAENYDEMMRMDIDYVESMSMWLDLKIITLTIPAIIRDRGVF